MFFDEQLWDHATLLLVNGVHYVISIGHSSLGVEMHHLPSVLIKHVVFAATDANKYTQCI